MEQQSGIEKTYSYDEMDRLISVKYEDGRQVVYSYDATGNRTAVSLYSAEEKPAIIQQKPINTGISAPSFQPPPPPPPFQPLPDTGQQIQPPAVQPTGQQRFCPKCGTARRSNKQFCSSCGYKFNP